MTGHNTPAQDEDKHEDESLMNLPSVTQYRFAAFWEIAAKMYDLVKFPAVDGHPRSQFHYVVVPGSRRTEDAIAAFTATRYFNARKRQFREAFVAFAAFLNSKQTIKSGGYATRKKTRKGRSKKRKKLQQEGEKLLSSSPNEDGSDLELSPNPDEQVNLVDKFVRKMQQEKDRHLERVAQTLTRIETRLQAINEESQQLEATRIKLQTEQTTLQNVSLSF